MKACVCAFCKFEPCYDKERAQSCRVLIAIGTQTGGSLRPVTDTIVSIRGSGWGMVLDAANPSWKSVRAATKELLTENSGGSWGDFKSDVALRLNVPVECLKPWKTKMKQVVAEGVKKGYSSDEEDDEGCSSDSGEQSRSDESEEDTRNGRHSSEAGVSKAVEESAVMKALKRMSKAMNLGPKPFQGLKNMDRKDAEKELRARLIDAGAQFKRLIPSSEEISRAQRKSDERKELEGIDMGNVVQGTRRRGRADDISPPNKKRRRGDAHVGSSDNEDSQGKGSGRGEDSSSDNEDSESEFEL